MNKKFLRSICHHLKPIVIIGNKGITPSLIEEVNRALEDHELIKIKINLPHSKERKICAEQICSELTADCIHTIGKTICLFRRTETPAKHSNLTRIKFSH